jgi:hypothetical protein
MIIKALLLLLPLSVTSFPVARRSWFFAEDNPDPRMGFTRDFKAFPFDRIRDLSSTHGGLQGAKTLFDDWARLLEKYIIEPPRVPINAECGPPTLPVVTEDMCKAHLSGFTGSLRASPAKAGHAINLGFDVDILEIHLNEVYDVVDRFFILESTRAHLGARPKPLMWDLIRDQPRFLKFHDKVVHLVMDDEVSASVQDNPSTFAVETMMEKVRWSKVESWNNVKHEFSDSDIVGFGDADEIASRLNIHLMKHCEFSGGQIDVGTWFAMDNIVDGAFRTDFPVPGHPYSLGDPTWFVPFKCMHLVPFCNLHAFRSNISCACIWFHHVICRSLAPLDNMHAFGFIMVCRCIWFHYVTCVSLAPLDNMHAFGFIMVCRCIWLH